MNHVEILKKEKEIFIKYLEANYPVFFNSNIFLRDLQYSVQRFFETKDEKISYTTAEKVALDFASELENEGELLRLTENSWKVNFQIEKKKEKTIEKSEPVETE